MDMMSSLSVQWLQLSDDPADGVWVRWKWTQPGAQPLPFPHIGGFGLWDDELVNAFSGPRVHLAGGKWRGNRTSPHPGTEFHGEKEWWQNGLPQSARQAGPVVDACGGEMWDVVVPLGLAVECDGILVVPASPALALAMDATVYPPATVYGDLPISLAMSARVGTSDPPQLTEGAIALAMDGVVYPPAPVYPDAALALAMTAAVAAPQLSGAGSLALAMTAAVAAPQLSGAGSLALAMTAAVSGPPPLLSVPSLALGVSARVGTSGPVRLGTGSLALAMAAAVAGPTRAGVGSLALGMSATVTVAPDANMWLSTPLNPEISLTNPSGAALTVSRWHAIAVTSASSVQLPAPSADKLVALRVTPGSTQLLTLTAPGAAQIDGGAFRYLWAGESAVLVSDGTHWYKVAGKTRPMVCHMELSESSITLPNVTMVGVLLSSVLTDNTGMMAYTGWPRCVRPGPYLAAGCASFGQLTVVNPRALCLAVKNDTYLHCSAEAYQGVGSLSTPSFVTSVGLVKDDTIKMFVFQNSGGNHLLHGRAAGFSTFLYLQEVPSW